MISARWANKTHYELLGLSKNATKAEIKQAYREIALVYHPDSNYYDEIVSVPSQGGEDSLFSRITAAYNVLINPKSRAEYDRNLPPELPKWKALDENVHPLEAKFHTYSQKMSAEGTKIRSSGVFGTLEKPPRSAFNSSVVHDTTPLSTRIKRSWKRRLVHRLCALFGI